MNEAERLAEWLYHHGDRKAHSDAADELRRLDEELTLCSQLKREYQEQAAQAVAECEQLRFNAARYDWLSSNALAIDTVADPDNQVQIWHGTDPAHCTCGRTLDEAIDAAIAKETK